VKIGWSGPFPPHRSGGAALTYWFLSEMVKHEDVQVYGYPDVGKLLPGVKPPIDPSGLDAMIFYYSSLLKEVYRWKGKTLLIAHHGFDNVYGTLKEFVNLLRVADIVISTDSWEKNKFVGAGLKNVCIVPYGCDTSKFKPYPKKPPVEVFYLGRLLVYKGFLQVLDAMRKVLAQYPKVRFRVHGYVDENWEGAKEIYCRMQNLLKQYPSRFVFEGYWTDPWEVPRLFEGADIFVFPSGRASLGIPMIEALACEIPVITTRYGSHGRVVTDQSGIRLEPKVEVKVKQKRKSEFWYNLVPSADDIYLATAKLIEDPELRRSMGSEGRKRVKQHYENTKVVSKLLEIVRENL